jgi:hypothetical protein
MVKLPVLPHGAFCKGHGKFHIQLCHFGIHSIACPSFLTNRHLVFEDSIAGGKK